MPVQSLTYAELSAIWGVSKDAARKKVEGLRLPRKLGNDGKTRVTIDLEEVRHSPKQARLKTENLPGEDLPDHPVGDLQEAGRPPSPEVFILQAMVETLKADLAGERQERRNEKDRADRLSHELIGMARALAHAEVEATKGHSESKRADDAVTDRDAWRSLAQRPWWKRIAG